MSVLETALVTQVKKLVGQRFIDQKKFLKQLVATKSANPYTPEFSDPIEPVELDVARLIRDKLKEFRLQPQMVGMNRKRPNVVVNLGPTRARKSLILNGHMDTVMPGASYRSDPYDAFMRGDRMYGLGVLDMKAALSAYVYAAKVLQDMKVKLAGRLMLQFVVDEEPGACSKMGTRYLLHHGYRAKAAILAEPGTQIGIGHRGGYRFKLTTKGEAVHTGVTLWQRREKGKNAIGDMARVIRTLRQFDLPHKSAKAFPRKKPVFTFPTLIHGGSGINVVPDKCEAYGDVRLMPGNSDRQVKLWINERLSKLEDVKFTLDDLLFVPAVEIDAREEIVEVLHAAYMSVQRKSVDVEGIGPWNDGWMFIQKDIPAVVQLPLEGGASHSSMEWVGLRSLRRLTTVLVLTTLAFLGIKKVN